MTDSNTNPSSGIAGAVGQLFSPPVVTALRYLLASLGPLFAALGVAVLSPDQIGKIVAFVQQVGTAVGALAAFLGLVGPIIAGVYGTFKSTQRQQIKSAQVIATGTAGPVAAEAQKALIDGVNAIAQDSSIPKSTEAKVALLDAVAAQPEVVGRINVTDQALVDATTSDQIKKAA